MKEEKPSMQKQQNIKASLSMATKADVDELVGEFFYACNIAPAIADHPSCDRARVPSTVVSIGAAHARSHALLSVK